MKMANAQLFQSSNGNFLPAADTRNAEAAPAYASPRFRRGSLAQGIAEIDSVQI